MVAEQNEGSVAPVAYDAVSRTLHWSVAALVIGMYVLGFGAVAWPMETGTDFAVKATLFSAHKTLGIVVLVLAVVRIGWALSTTAPAPLAQHPRALRWMAGTVHWALYVALLAVPLTGWLHHVSSEGFAPIWWPFGQSVSFVPRDAALSATFGNMHYVANKLLAVLVIGHVGGALLHHLRDRDVTLLRMLRGRVPPAPTAARPGIASRALPAMGLWAVALSLGLLLPRSVPVAESALGPGQGNWVVESGELALTVTQIRDRVTGRFGRWTADIAFSPEPVAGRHGQVRVEIDVTSLTMGAVTSDVLAPEFFDARNHPLAVFEATIEPDPERGYVADGHLTLKGVTVAVRLPFALEIEDDTAHMTGGVVLDRRHFGIGPNYPDEATVGFSAEVAVTLNASRRVED
ncbi:MAG: cytochrome b/b6 domain-containing protein [Pararhodobacter sp.]|nr:cytochrome b/b6 domain-containing protein [Pararhodobacter sp.]